MSRIALPCIACGRELKNVEETATNQPYGGTAFNSHGHYGSTAYDPFDGRFLEINVCDSCLVLHADRALEGRDKEPIMEDGTIVGWKDARWTLVPWNITKAEAEYILEVALKDDDLTPLPLQALEESPPDSTGS